VVKISVSAFFLPTSSSGGEFFPSARAAKLAHLRIGVPICDPTRVKIFPARPAVVEIA
jgi:hypothetical protein